jgi:hypothetical protein
MVLKEINPQEVTIDQLRQADPRTRMATSSSSRAAPGPRIWLDSGVADKAGHARNDQTGRSCLRRPLSPHRGGGDRCASELDTDPVRVDILNGVQKLKRALARKQYLMTREAWDAGERAIGNSLEEGAFSYAWDTTEQPKKDGSEDPLDALRYDCIFSYWADVVARHVPRSARVDKSSRNARPSSASF